MIGCLHLALSQPFHAACFQSTVFEETALELYCHKGLRTALLAQRTLWQGGMLIANAKKEKSGKACRAESIP